MLDESSRCARPNLSWRIATVTVVGWLFVASCSGVPPAQPQPLTQLRPLTALLQTAAYPNSDIVLVLLTMQQLTATHHEWEGYEYFGRLAREQPARRAFFRSLQAAMQARVANDVPFWRRTAWVEDAIRKLDGGATVDPTLGRLARGLVFAELPARFGKARQAVDDLQAALAHGPDVPLGISRGIHRGLAAAFRTLGDERQAQEMLARAGLESLDDASVPRVLGDLSVDATHGFRFAAKRFHDVADGVYVAEGYDFSNLDFIVTPQLVAAIDAGTSEETAGDAVSALRRVTKAPIKYVILTHGHWDHVGGLAALREPGTTVIARVGLEQELERSRRNRPPFQYFFGMGTMRLDVKPDRLIAAPEPLRDGGLDLVLIPADSGETDDALFVQDRKHGLLFVGDAFMPYVGAPFVAEGSPEGFVAAIATVVDLHPQHLVHGHPPLTSLFTIDAMPGLREAMGALYERGLASARRARPLADLLNDNFIPDSLRAAPAAVQPYLVVRDTFLQRLYTRHAGYWQSNGDGIDVFTHAEWAAALDLLSGGSDAAFVRTATQLERRGDAALALQIVELGLIRHPSSTALQAIRERALTTLREIYSQDNPFRFIVYSEWAKRGMGTVR